jgi:hypothetical protein
MQAIPFALQAQFEEYYEIRQLQRACKGCIKNGCAIIWTFAGSIIFLLYIKRVCATLSANCWKRSKRRRNKKWGNIFLPEGLGPFPS